ncbi:MAG TPA: 30S ribosome-binding factor RbfA [Tepidiformaceae bacterium]|nr:30S ribosome-binding factor RbfA [Tepidiformaceae bacterium]
MGWRTSQVNELLREELSELLLREVKDPRVDHGLVSITEVQVSPDLHHATVYVSHLGDPEDRDELIAGLQHAAPFLHRELVHRLKMKIVPELLFRYDPSIERGARLASLIDQVTHQRGADAEGTGD